MSLQGPQLDSAEAIGAVDAILANVGLEHGRRATRAGTWHGGERRPKGKSAGKRQSVSREKPGLVTVPGWDAFPWLCAGFSTREGGQSTVYGAEGRHRDLNLGWTDADEPETVQANRRRFLRAVQGSSGMPLITQRQFHSSMIRDFSGPADQEVSQRRTPEGKAMLRGDGMLSGTRRVMLGIITADCVPVLLADTRTHAVAAFHAGWRGTLARIVEHGVGSMRLRFGTRPADLVAAIGPSIGACCFAVGEEVRFDFQSQFAYAPDLFSEVYDSDPVREKYPLLFLTARAPGHSNIGPQIHLDLVEANRRQLLDAGVPAERISVVGECTACTRTASGHRKYFSHRDEHGFTGRMLSVIGALE